MQRYGTSDPNSRSHRKKFLPISREVQGIFLLFESVPNHLLLEVSVQLQHPLQESFPVFRRGENQRLAIGLPNPW